MAVTIYTTPTCAFCHAAKEWMKSRNVAYSEIDVSRDPNGVKKLIDLSGQLGVPVIDVDGLIIVGFNRPHLEVALRDKKLL